MKFSIIKYLSLSLVALSIAACQDSESDLLKAKVYFENNVQHVSMPDTGTSLEVDITARISNKQSSSTAVSYSLADPSLVTTYNHKYGTDYIAYKAENATLSKTSSTIEAGQIYADKVVLSLNNLDQLEEGKNYMLPVKVHSSSTSIIEGEDIEYILLAKPIRISKVALFYDSFISVKFPTGTYFKSFTYEALINPYYFGNNNTIMGTEGIMILRIGDVGGGIAKDILQIAGQQHYEAPEALQTNKWYHIALTYDQATGKTVMYLNGTKWAESAWSIPGFNPNSDVGFNIGKIPNFPWGTRPFYGYMSEVRVWSVARTENQIKQNMLSVDPKSEGLELYFKMNGSEKSTSSKITDAAKGIECSTNNVTIENLDHPIMLKDLQ